MDPINLKSFQNSFLTSHARHPALVSAWGTGKSMMAIMRGILLSEQYPGNLGMIVRKEFVALRDSTMKDYEKYTGRRVNVQAKEDRLANKSVIMFRHAKELTSANLQNVNLGWFLIEQAEEFETSDVFFMLNGRLRREDKVKFRTGFVIANANGHNWIWDLWPLSGRKQKEKDFPAWEATTFDNKENLPKDFVDSLKYHKKYRPNIYERFVLNSHETEGVGNWVVPVKLFELAQTLHIHEPQEKRLITCDPSMGGDRCVAYALSNTRIIAEKIFPPGFRDPMKIAGELVVFKRRNKASLIAIDGDMLGQSIASRLLELGHSVLPVNTATRLKDNTGLYNIRAKMWMDAGDMFIDRKIDLNNFKTFDYGTLKKQITSVKFKVVKSNGLIIIEPKADVKDRLGYSPDHADAYVIGLYALKFCKTQEEISKKKDPYRYREEEDTGSWMSA